MNQTTYQTLRHNLRHARRMDRQASERNEYSTLQSPWRHCRTNETRVLNALSTEQALTLSLTDGRPVAGSFRWGEAIERKLDGLSKRIALRRAVRQMENLRHAINQRGH